MYLSLKWLQEFTPYTGSVDRLAHALTMRGLEVEEVREPFAAIKDVVVGYVRSCEPHPNADKLTVCEVDLGRAEPVSIVCGAPNVAPGQLVPVAPVGSTLPSGMKVKRAKIRGLASEGMIASEHELELGEDQSGILVLDREAEPGRPLEEGLDLDTVVLDIGITPNRGDCLSILGLAREVALAFDLPLHLPQPSFPEQEPKCASQLAIDVQDPQGCPLYQARIIDGIRVSRSPDWMRHRLLAMGLRPINAVVDVTNYVLLEMGQPLHAFDGQLVQGGRIGVARAEEGQRFTTLDGQERLLNREDLLIWDAQKPIALAGVMGGLNSEISLDSSQVILECAIFDPESIRQTARRLNLHSEASYRFERGVDQPGSSLALERAAELLHQLTGGRVLQGVSRHEPRPFHPEPIEFRPAKAKALLALEIDAPFCRHTLQGLGCDIRFSDSPVWQVLPPGFRYDLLREVDLIEEIGRIYGFEHTPTRLPHIAKPLQAAARENSRSADFDFLSRIKAWAKGQGFKEAINYSFVGWEELNHLGLVSEDLVPLENPLTSDQDTLRPVLAPGLLQNIRHNIDQNNRDLRLFEVARSFHRHQDEETGCKEQALLGLALHGNRNPLTWPWTQEEADYSDLKGAVEHLLESLHLQGAGYVLQDEHPFLDPCARLEISNEPAGTLGRLKPALGRTYHARSPVWLAEINLNLLYRLHLGAAITYRPWSKFPPVFRDMTLIAGLGVSFAEIEQTIRHSDIPHLESFVLLDLYQPRQGSERNLTLRMIYRHAQRTLTDKEVDAEHQRLGQAVLDSLPVRFP